MTSILYDNLDANSDTQELKLQGLGLPSYMTRMLYGNLDANSDTQELKVQGLRLPKEPFYDFKVAIKF